MEFAGGKRDVVDPEVRAYVASLVTALGGSGADEDGRYVLGDDALACLRDLKRWLKLYDEKANRLDVARCLAESNLVEGDLLQILASWSENAPEDRLKAKTALSCLELLVPLTWPLDKTREMTVNHHRHMPYLEMAQLGYKRSLINFDGARIMHTAIRCAIPSMSVGLGDRSTRDEGIIKLLLYLLRNIAMIAPPPNVLYEGDEAEISRSATIDAFNYQDVFQLLLTISSSMGEDFNTQDVIVMEILFYLIKGVDIEKLFVDQHKVDKSMMEELVRLRKKEAAMLRSYQMNAPSRHNRFGAMAWMQRGDAKMATISGQAAITDSTKGLAKMDSTKKFKPPQRAPKGEAGPMDFDTPALLSPSATKNLRSFVEDFLDSGFNPLFNHIRKAIDREAERVLENHPRQFFYLVSWFLEAERVRRKTKKMPKNPKPEDLDSFSLVASVLNQEMFVTLNRAMETNYENKLWADLSAAMKCFTQILLTVQEMSESPLEDDQDIAENILNRIFYEDTTHDRVANIARTYKDQGFGYLDACTELAHNYLRILEHYSKQNVDLQVRSRRRVRKKKKAAQAAGDDDGDDNGIIDESEGEDEARAQKITGERKFDFKRFAARFVTQGCVDTFVTFTAYYNDLKPAQLKRAHRYFYRVAFKQEMSVMLFRVDIIALLYKMIKGPEGLDPSGSTYKEWDELVKQILKKCTRKIQERPELIVEMLFSKVNSSVHYLEYGYEKQVSTTKPRAAAELEVKPGMEWEEQIGVVVGAMLDRNEGEHLTWLMSQLNSAESERRSWEGANTALIPSVEKDPAQEPDATPVVDVEKPTPPSITIKHDTKDRKTALFKNGHLRLLMTLVSLQRIGDFDDPDASWIIPSSLSAAQLKQSHDLIKNFEFSPPSYDDGREAGDFIRRKSTAASYSSRKKAAFDDEDDDIDDDDEELLFEPGGPTAMKKSDALAQLKKIRRKRRKDTPEEGEEETGGLTDEQIKERADARRKKEREKNEKIKSEKFVKDSDDEDDEERDRVFFEQEEKIRQRAKKGVMAELLGAGEKSGARRKVAHALDGGSDDEEEAVVVQRKKKSAVEISDDDDNTSEEEEEAVIVVAKSKKRAAFEISDEEDEDEDEDEILPKPKSSTHSKRHTTDSDDEQDTPLSSQHERSSQAKPQQPEKKRRKVSVEAEENGVGVEKMQIDDNNDEDEDEDDDVAIAKPTRQRKRTGFVVESSDEE